MSLKVGLPTVNSGPSVYGLYVGVVPTVSFRNREPSRITPGVVSVLGTFPWVKRNLTVSKELVNIDIVSELVFLVKKAI